MKKLLLMAVLSLVSIEVSAQHGGYYENPVIKGDVADPSIIRYSDNYYAMGTSSEWAPHYPIFESKDMINWRPCGHLFDETPEWLSSSFWAPEWFVRDGKVYVYYTARKRVDGISCIGVAVAESPTDKFVDYGPVVEFGNEAIDAFVLEDNGELYISWKAYGLASRSIELLACRLSQDGLRLEGEPFSLLRDDKRQGMEGQHWFKYGDYYYIIYAVKGCCGPASDYAVEVARSRRLEGPYELCVANPILEGNDEDILSIGHGTLVATPQGEMYYMCHAYKRGSGFYCGRQPYLLPMEMGDDMWPRFVMGARASLRQPMPAGVEIQRPQPDFYDDFSAEELRDEWSWNFVDADVKWNIESGALLLGGKSISDKKSGVAMCLRPTSSDYRFQAAVADGDSCRGVVIYGDAGNFATMCVEGQHICLKIRNDGREQVLAEMEAPHSALHLCVNVKDGVVGTFLWSDDGATWHQLGEGSVDLKNLMRWDRVARPGLYHHGDENGVASRFLYAGMKNTIF